jgi:hypothetical protein
VKGGLLFALVTLALFLAMGWLLGLAFPAAADRSAIWVSAAVAYGVQMLAFAVARLAAPKNVWAGWGVGIALRLVTLVIYAFLIVRAFELPATAALISLATFFFVSIVVEPVMLTI